MCLNARSIINKKTELNIMVDDIKPHIIRITESWANNDITDAELGLGGYVMFRKDRMGRRGGGILYWLLKLYFYTSYRGLFALSYRNPSSRVVPGRDRCPGVTSDLYCCVSINRWTSYYCDAHLPVDGVCEPACFESNNATLSTVIRTSPWCAYLTIQ